MMGRLGTEIRMVTPWAAEARPRLVPLLKSKCSDLPRLSAFSATGRSRALIMLSLSDSFGLLPSLVCKTRKPVELRGACSALRAAPRSACLDCGINGSAPEWPPALKAGGPSLRPSFRMALP